MTEKIICECGMLVKGTSKKHVNSNLEKHKRSRRHKELMKLKKAQQDAHRSKSDGSESRDEGAAND